MKRQAVIDQIIRLKRGEFGASVDALKALADYGIKLDFDKYEQIDPDFIYDEIMADLAARGRLRIINAVLKS